MGPVGKAPLQGAYFLPLEVDVKRVSPWGLCSPPKFLFPGPSQDLVGHLD